MWQRRLKYYLITLLRLEGAPSLIAMGFTLGACVNFYPAFGVAILVAAFLARMTGTNIPAAILGNLLFKPFFLLFFYINILTGDLFYGNKSEDLSLVWQQVIHFNKESFATLGKVFFTGALVNTLILGLVIFLAIFNVIKNYRKPLARWLNKKRKILR